MESSYSYRIHCHHQNGTILQKHVHYGNSDKHGWLVAVCRMVFVPRHAQILTRTSYLASKSQEQGHSGRSLSTPLLSQPKEVVPDMPSNGTEGKRAILHLRTILAAASVGLTAQPRHDEK